MKLHLPKPLRNSVLACIAAVAGIATPTLGTATFAGGVVAFSFAQQAMAAPVVADNVIYTQGENVTLSWSEAAGYKADSKVLTTQPAAGAAEVMMWKQGETIPAASQTLTLESGTYANVRFSQGSVSDTLGSAEAPLDLSLVVTGSASVTKLGNPGMGLMDWGNSRSMYANLNVDIDTTGTVGGILLLGEGHNTTNRLHGDINVEIKSGTVNTANYYEIDYSLISSAKNTGVNGNVNYTLGVVGTTGPTINGRVCGAGGTREDDKNFSGDVTITINSGLYKKNIIGADNKANVSGAVTINYHGGTLEGLLKGGVLSRITGEAALNVYGELNKARVDAATFDKVYVREGGVLTFDSSFTTLTNLVNEGTVSIVASEGMAITLAQAVIDSSVKNGKTTEYTIVDGGTTTLTGAETSDQLKALFRGTGLISGGTEWAFNNGKLLVTMVADELTYSGGTLEFGVGSELDNDAAFTDGACVIFQEADADVTLTGDVTSALITIEEGVTVNLHKNGHNISGPIAINGTLIINEAANSLVPTADSEGTVVVNWGGTTLNGTPNWMPQGYNGNVVIRSGRLEAATQYASVTVEEGGQFAIRGTYAGDITISGMGVADNSDNAAALKFCNDGVITGNVTAVGDSSLLAWGSETGKFQGLFTADADVYVNKHDTGTIYFERGLDVAGTVHVHKGLVRLGNNQHNVIGLSGGFKMYSGSTLEFNCNAGDASGVDIELAGGKMKMEDMGSTTDTLKMGTLAVTAESLIEWHYNGGFEFAELTGSGALKLQGSSDSAPDIIRFRSLNDYTGVITRTGNNTFEVLSIGQVSVSEGLSTTIDTDIIALDFVKTGDGALVLGGNVTTEGSFGVNYEGTITFGEGVSISVADGTLLTYTGDNNKVISLGTLNTNVGINLLGVTADALAQGINLGIAVGEGGIDALKPLLNVLYLDDYNLSNVDGMAWLTSTKLPKPDWDLNWGTAEVLSGPTALTATEVTGTLVLNGNADYDKDGYVAIEATTGGADVLIFGGISKGAGDASITASEDVWIKASSGTFLGLIGGSRANNWQGSGNWNLNADTHIQVEGENTVVGHLIGGYLQECRNPHFNADSYISVMGGEITGNIAGSSATCDGDNYTSYHTGNTNIFIYVPLSDSTTAADLVTASDPKHVVTGGALSLVHNQAGRPARFEMTGDTHVTIDLGDYVGTKTTFAKAVYGGNYTNRTNDNCVSKITGNTNVSIEGAGITFSKDIVGGSLIQRGDALITGTTSLLIDGGTYAGNIVAGSYSAEGAGNGDTSEVGATRLAIKDGIFTASDKGVYGGSFLTSGEASVSVGAVDVSIEGGTITNMVGGHLLGDTGTAALNASIGDINVTVSGGEVQSLVGGSVNWRDNAESVVEQGHIVIDLQGGTVGDVYAAGSQQKASKLNTASTKVMLDDSVSIASGKTVSGGYKYGAGLSGSTVTGSSTLVFSGTQDRSALALADFSVLTVGGSDKVTIGSLTTTTAVTKNGTGLLTLKGGSYSLTGGVTVAEGTLATSGTTVLGGALTLADGAGLNISAGSLAIDGALALGTGMVLTMGEIHLGDNVIISGVTGVTGLTGEVDASSIFSTITGITNIEDYKVKYSDNSLVLVNASAKELTWDVQYDTWSNGQAFATVDGAAVNFENNDIATFGALTENEAVAIHSDGVTATSVTISAGEGKSYTFSGGSLSTGALHVNSGTAVFGSGTLNIGSLSALEVNGVLDITAMGTNLTLLKKLTQASGSGTVKIGNGWSQFAADAAETHLELGVNIEAIDSIEILRQGGSMQWDVTKSIKVIDGNDAGKNGDVLVGRHVNMTVKSGGSIDAVGAVKLGNSNVGSGDVGSILSLEQGGSIKAGSIAVGRAGTVNSFTMSGGTLELTSTAGVVSGIATTITGGTLVAKEASWGITGATIGGATVTDGTLNCAVQIQTAGLDTENADDDTSITLTNATLTGTLDNAAGKLVLAGAVTINGSGFNKQETLDDFSNGGTDGFATTDTYYQLVTTAGNLSIADGTTWNMGEYVATGDKAGWVRVDGTQYGDIYYLNTADASTTLSAIKSHAGTTYTLSSIALKGGNLEYDVTDAAVAINVQESGVIKITDADTTDTTEVVLSSSQVTVASGKTATLTGNGVYDIGSTALGINGETVVNAVKVSGLKDAANWTGTVVVKDSVGTSNKLGLNELGNANSTVKLVNTQGYLWNGSGSNTLASVDTNVILADSDNEYNAALTIANGSSKSERENEGHVMSTFTKKVSGTGNMAFSWTAGYTGLAFTGDVSEWTGAFIVTAGNDTGNGHVNLKFSGDANVIKADLKRSASDRQQLMVYLDDAGATDTTAGITMHGSIEATKLTLGLADDTADSRAKVNLNNSVTVDTLANYAATTLAGAKNLTVGTLTNAGTLTVNGTLAAGAAVTNNGTLELTQAAATLASLAGTGTVTAESLVLTGAATGSNGITADSLTLQAATNTVGALTLDTLTLGVAAVKNADGVITTAGVASTLVTTGQLSATGDVKVLTLGAGITETTGDVTTSYGMLKAAGLAGTLNFVIAEEELTRYMGTSNTLTLATITGLTTTDAVSLNKVAGNTQWSDTDHAWTDSEGQYTYALSVDANGTLTLTRENLGIIWNGAPGEKWVMDDATDEVADNMSWTDKSGATDLAYTGAESVIFDGKGITDVIISGDVETKNVNINAEGKTYTFTGDADTDVLDTLEIQNKLSVLKGTLKADAGLDVYAEHSVEVLNGAAMELLSGASVHALAGISNAGTVTIGAANETQGAAALYVEGEGSVNNSGTMEVNGMLQAGYGMGVAAKGSNINNSGTLTNAGMIKADGNLDNSGTYTQTAGSLTVYGNVLNTGSVTETTPAGGMNITDGYAVVGGNLTNSGAMSISGGAQTRVDDLYEEDCDNLEVGGNLVNTGIFTVSGEGTKVTVGDVDNDGTLSVAGGSMTVTGNLDNTDGDIIIGTAAVADNPETDEDETLAATNGTLSVKGNLIHAGDGDIVVNGGSSLDVTGDLEADGMTLGFDGSVTVGGNAEVADLTINEGASFTANQAEIGSLANDGTLSVGAMVDGVLTGGDLSIGELTGSGAVNVGNGGALNIDTMDGSGSVTVGNNGALKITTLNGTGNVAVGEGGTLYIENDATFTGTVDNMGTVATDNKLTLTQQTSAGGTVSAAELVVTQDANGSSFTAVTTDSITIESLATDGSVHLTTGALAGKTGNSVDLVLSQLTTAEGMADIIATGEHTYNLLSIGGTAPGLTMAELDADLEQQLWKSGLKLGELESATTMALRASSTNVSISVLVQSEDDAKWFVGKTATEIGLTVIDANGKLLSNDILDNVQKVVVSGTQSIDMTGDITKATINKLVGTSPSSKLTIAGDGKIGDSVSIGESSYNGTLVLDGVAADFDLTGATVVGADKDTTLSGKLTNGTLSVQQSSTAQGAGLELTNSTVQVVIDKDFDTLSNTKLSALEGAIARLGDVTAKEGCTVAVGTSTNGAFTASAGYDKYFDMSSARVEGGKVVADRNTVYYTSKLADSSSTDNGKAGLAMADEALVNANPQGDTMTGDLAAVLDQLDEYVAKGNKAAADELGASLAGASTAVLGMAAMGDVDRQLRAIRNRTTTMGVDQSVVNADMPYFNAWINAEGDSREMGEDETLGGYKLNSYGGTVGFDVDIEPTLTAGMALTAMYGDLDATGTDKATGNLDSYYVSAFARYCGSAWTHTFVGTIGMGDISLDRTVGSAQVKGETDSMSFGLMYEVGRVYAMDEDGTTCLQPVFNVTWKHTTVDAYTEKGGDVALSVDEQSLDTITFGLGARLQTVVGESMYNRTSIFECRLLAKADAGDTEGTSKVALGSSATHEVKSNEMGAIGIEVGAGLTIPLGDEGSSIFMDASAEIRADYTDVNGTVGYRVNF